MPDHGLFGAGIVYDIAWAAEIHLIRVLGDTGVGDLLALTHALSQLPALLLSGENAGKRLIVNLSLMLDIPPSEHLLSLWFPRTSASLPALRRRWSDVCRTLTLLQSSIVEVIDWLGEQGALVVAAAGNDNLGATVRPEPRLPARHESVLSVAAVDMTRQPAGFSNRGDAPGFGNGLAVLGGNAALAGGGGPPQISRGGDGQPDAVVGIFSADELPLGAGKNETGWAYWVGTSFATPIISAIAARVWCVNPHLTPDEVKAAVHAFATSPEGALDCSAVIAWQQT